ncbi:MAG: LamG domain-containing protein [Ignavibacteriae bacterium]|nr:LamG domain-containing protein [Ignavibacteriota bacterium]
MFRPRYIAAGLLLAAVPLCLAPARAQQIAIPRIEQMPAMPSPYLMRDWKSVARGYDSLAFDLDRTGQYLPLVFLNTGTVNYPGTTSFGLHSYVGDDRSESGEAINVLPAVLSGVLNGIDKRSQNGRDWVVMSQEYFNNRPAEDVYLNSPASNSGSDWWYDVMPNVFFYQLAGKYPGAGDEAHQFTRVAERWLQAVTAMGGSVAPWSHPGLEHRGWHLSTMTPNNAMPHEPEAGGSIGWILYHAWVVTGDARYRYGAELCMEELNAYMTNPAYELQLAYGTSLAARMNAEAGTAFDVEKMVNWCFDISPIRSWGATVGRWGSYDCAGLIGEVNGSNDYAFAMNTFQQIGALVPLVRYDARFARAIGRWALNAANASRLFYGDYLPDANQDSRAWSRQYDPASVIAYEALRQRGAGTVAPYATGDAIAGGWAPTNLSLYSSSHAGILGAIIDTTEVRGILKLDLLATDHFHAPAYPSYLLYNPDSIAHGVQLAVGAGNADVYDAAARAFVVRGATGAATVTIPARGAIVAVITPAGGAVSYDEERMKVNGVVVDFHSANIPGVHRPRIKGMGAAPSLLFLNGTAALYCTATDRDGDVLSYHWTASAGDLAGSGASVAWKAPGVKGTYVVACTVVDAQGDSVTGQVNIGVVDSALSVPVIRSIVAVPGKVDLGAQATVTCQASEDSGALLSYAWRASAGSITGAGSTAVWTAPQTAENVYIVCSVKNSVGGADAESVLVPVRDLSKTGSGSCILNIPCNGTLADVSGSNGQVHGTDITFVADRDGTAGHACGYNGASSALRVTESAVLNCDSAITVSFWMKPGIAANKEMFLISHGSWQNRWKISLTPERRIRWTVKTSVGVKDVDSRTVAASGTYYHVAGVFNGTDLEVYPVDGADADTGHRSDGGADAADGRQLQLRGCHRRHRHFQFCHDAGADTRPVRGVHGRP